MQMLMHGCHGKLFDKQPMSPTEPEGLPYSKAKPAELGCRVSLNMENTMVRKLENQTQTATLESSSRAQGVPQFGLHCGPGCNK